MKVRTFIRVCVCVCARVCVSISLDYSVCVCVFVSVHTHKRKRTTNEGRGRVGARKKEKRNDIQKFAFFWLTMEKDCPAQSVSKLGLKRKNLQNFGFHRVTVFFLSPLSLSLLGVSFCSA